MTVNGTLARKRCYNHPHREAVAVCSSCGNHFCRECVSEHEGRMTCSFCLEEMMPGKAEGTRLLSIPFRYAGLAGSLIFLWLLFYYLGQILLRMPSSFHEGTMWKMG